MTKHKIEIEDLPEGWEPVAFRKPLSNDETILYDGEPTEAKGLLHGRWLIIQKPKPRRIVLEEDITDHRNPARAQTIKLSTGRIMHIFSPHAVREIKEE